MPVEISAIICTRNQSTYLRKSLASLLAQSLPKEQFEIITVDNASTDDTKQVITAFKSSGNINYIHDPFIGLSHARNTGWRNASGQYVAYLDDDAIAAPNWLQSILTGFRTVFPRPASVGGRISPIWETQRPKWLLKEMETYVGIINWSKKPMFLTDGKRYLSGSNVSYRTEILQQSPGFDISLGRKDRVLLSNEEILMQRYLRRRNLAVWYDPGIHVSHHVKPLCMKKEWFYRRYYWQGVQIRKDWRVGYRIIHDIRCLGSALWTHLNSLYKASQRSELIRCWVHYWFGRMWFDIRIALRMLKIHIGQ
jgi:glycosyltransferase involved in cell wall biosynthesis